MSISDEALAQIIANLKQQKPAEAKPEPWCRAGCGERLDPVLVDRPDGSGLHLMCQEPRPQIVVEQPTLDAPAGPPPSTLDELRQVLIDYDAARPRSRQTALGPSELGTPCQQQIARKIAGAPRRPVEAPMWAPIQGTAIHAEMERVMRWRNRQLGRERWIVEDTLDIDPGLPDVPGIRGHGDAYDLDHGMVVDWKHVGTSALNKLRAAKRAGKPPAEQVSPAYRIQAHLYGRGHERKGREVRYIRLVLLARSHQFDDSEEWTEEYQPDVADEAILRYYATHDLLAALKVSENPDFIAAVPATPDPDTCRWCPFHRPGQPSGWEGCAGDPAVHERRVAAFADGLIAPKTPASAERRSQ